MKDNSSTQREILLKIKAALKNTDFEDVNWPDDKKEDIENFIWIGFQNRLIGREICHYEFIFQPEEPDILSLEVHFEVKKYKDLWCQVTQFFYKFSKLFINQVSQSES